MILTSEQFARLFRGYSQAYGTYSSTEMDAAKGKVEMVGSVTRRMPVTGYIWQDHLVGTQPLAIIPIDQEQRAQWGAIDIDIYGIDHLELIKRVNEFKLPLTICRSKSGGAHAYLFLDKAYPARAVRSELQQLAALLGYGNAEIFPKQGEVHWENGDLGSALNLPYFGGDTTTRYAYDDEGRPLTLAGFLKVKPVGLGDWKRKLAGKPEVGDPEAEGPPCLQALYKVGFPAGARHNALYDIGIFLKKAYPREWEQKLGEYHERYFQPPKPADLADVVKSLGKKDYNYKCHDPPIVSHCNRPLCLTRRYGVSAVNGVTYTDLAKLDTVPPVYFMSVGERRVQLSSVEILDHRHVVRRTMEVVDQLPPAMTDFMWKQTLKELLAGMTVVPAGGMPTPVAMARQALVDYVRRGRRRPADAEGKIDLSTAAWVPLIDGKDVYVNWMRFIQDYQKRVRCERDVLAVLYQTLEVEETEHPLVQKVRLEDVVK